MEAKQTEIDFLLEKIRTGNLSEPEKANLHSYVEAAFRDEKISRLMERHWRELETEHPDQEGQDLQKIRQLIMEKVRSSRYDCLQQRKKSIAPWMNYMVRAAAILAIPLLIISGYLYYRLTEESFSFAEQPVMQEVIATPGSRVHFILPDRSEVWLNSGSSLSFSNGLMTRGQRRVRLMGQGYFQVTRDERHPFIVEAGDLNVRVLGTSFDVSNYAEDEFIRSTLEDGAIALLNPSGDRELASLKPGQQAVFRKQTKELSVYQTDTRLSTSWKDGKLIFRDTPLKEVTRQLERWFNCTIQTDPELLHSGILYTATIRDETLGEVLKMIEISTQVKTKIKNRSVKIWAE